MSPLGRRAGKGSLRKMQEPMVKTLKGFLVEAWMTTPALSAVNWSLCIINYLSASQALTSVYTWRFSSLPEGAEARFKTVPIKSG